MHAAQQTPQTPQQTQTPQPPSAPIREVVDTYFGTSVADPYRWMEESSPEFRAWLEGQNRFAREALDAIPARAPLEQRILQLSDDSEKVDDVTVVGSRRFLLRRGAGEQTRKLCVVENRGPERVLLSVEPRDGDATHRAIDFFAPSPNGRYVAYGLSTGGSEESTLYILETSSAKPLSESIDRARFAAVSWLPSSDGFLYTRQPQTAPGAAVDDSYKRLKTYRHRLGSSPTADLEVFGFGVPSSPGIDEDLFPRVNLTYGSRFAVGALDHGVNDPLTLLVKATADLGRPDRPWIKVVSPEEGVFDFAVRGDDIFLLTNHDAPRLKVVRRSLIGPKEGRGPLSDITIVPASPSVLQHLYAARDALYVLELTNGVGSVRRFAFDGQPQAAPTLPFVGAITASFADATRDGLLVRLEGWTHSEDWLELNPGSPGWRDTQLTPPAAADYSDVVVTETFATSKDGTRVPLTIIHKRDVPLNHTNPTVLFGYGCYGIPYGPYFLPYRLALLERGAIMAYAHVRGGGEFGDEWHRAGQKENKHASVEDFLAGAETLISAGYTSREKLAAYGQSAGGLLMGAAMTARPDLFHAMVVNVGTTNMLRSELTGGGAANAAEFGTTATSEGFRYLYEVDGYHHVQKGVQYPATLFSVGANDPRVPAWQSTKMVARIQAMSPESAPTLLRVDFDDGHGVGSTRALEAARNADFYAFFLWTLGHPDFQTAAKTAVSPSIQP